ncbi:homeobox domain-containing protein 16 [Vairimorpha necatrix]|uniref:Homeobox domain-containing protein 16 n=1 Tax=Vairimorpha necatrix TaxID=6039 RepID=A0AAX4JD35_9MICR
MDYTFQESEAICDLLFFKYANKKKIIKKDKFHNIKSQAQINLLNSVFDKDPYPNKNVKILISDLFEYEKYDPIQNWFQNKRQMSKVKGKRYMRRGISNKRLVEICVEYLREVNKTRRY